MTTTDDGLSGKELEPAFGRNLPAPHDLVGELRERLHERVTQLRAARGEVLEREDTYVPIRALAALSEGLTDYGRAFLKIAGETNAFVQDELVEAVGEQQGIPLSGMRVPDADGTDIKIDLNTQYTYGIELDPVLTAAAMFTMRHHDAMTALQMNTPGIAEETLANLVADLMVEGMRTLIECGNFTPQKTKVEALKTEIARIAPKVASTITVHRKSEFRGVKVRREQPK